MRHEQDLPRDLFPPRSWPEQAPSDLRLSLMDALSYRSVSAEDVWEELRDWLEQHGVPVPMSVLHERARAAPSWSRQEGV